jgi:hypothetical protein
MICRCIKDYRISWAGCSIICYKGRDYRCVLDRDAYIFIDFPFLHQYDGFPVSDLSFNEHFLDISEIREEKLEQLLK